MISRSGGTIPPIGKETARRSLQGARHTAHGIRHTAYGIRAHGLRITKGLIILWCRAVWGTDPYLAGSKTKQARLDLMIYLPAYLG